MADLNPAKRKPRRTKGTPTYYFRNKFAFSVLATGCFLFGLYALTPFSKAVNKEFSKYYFHPTEEELDRKELFYYSLVRQRRGEEILQLIEEQKKVDSEF